MRGKIFISYRRDDSKADARSIYQRLERTFGASKLFIDIDTVRRGFPRCLNNALAACQVMLVIIGPNWLHVRNQNGTKRIHDLNDFARIEIATALKRNIPIIPIRIDGAPLPTADELPADVKGLTHRQALIVTHDNFAADVGKLERDIRAMVGSKTQRLLMAAGIAAVVAFITLGYQFVVDQLTKNSAQLPSLAYLKCAMTDGIMQGRTYSFSIDLTKMKATWAEYSKRLEIVHFDDSRIHARGKMTLAGWPDHDEIAFNFNRLTRAVTGSLAKTPSNDEISKCKQAGQIVFGCDDPLVVGTSGGRYEIIDRGF